MTYKLSTFSSNKMSLNNSDFIIELSYYKVTLYFLFLPECIFVLPLKMLFTNTQADIITMVILWSSNGHAFSIHKHLNVFYLKNSLLHFINTDILKYL